MRSLLVTVVVVAGLAAVTTAAGAGLSRGDAKPQLKVLRTTPLVVQGSSFAPRVRVVVTALTGLGPRVVRTRSTARGTFKAVFREVTQPCGAVFAVRARGLNGQAALLHLVAKPCVPPPVD